MNNIILTQDGSNTLLNKTSGEHYHSIFGAVQESKHIFIDSGLNFKSQSIKSINVLEIGMGSGLNALLTLLEASTGDHLVNYIGIEPFPIETNIAERLNYCEYLEVPDYKEAFNWMHNCPVEIPIELSSNFNFRKFKIKFENFETETKFDLVYFDAFSPDNEPQLWTDIIFTKVHSMMNKGGILVTYCSKGIVRRTMQSCNFITERLKGPPGKHEILRATAI